MPWNLVGGCVLCPGPSGWGFRVGPSGMGFPKFGACAIYVEDIIKIVRQSPGPILARD